LLPFAAISLCYFGFIGLFSPYAPLWYQSLGYSTFAIGVLTSLQSATRLFAPYAWGWWADYSGRREPLLRLAIGGAVVSSLGFFLFRDYAWIAAVCVALMVCTAGVVPISEAVLAHHVSSGGQVDIGRYGRVRLWGSVGFVVAAVAFGGVLWARQGARNAGADWLVPVAMWLALVAAFIAALPLRGTGEGSPRPRAADVKVLVAQPRLLLLLLAAALHWICLTPYNIYLGIFLRDLGLPPPLWGLAYATGTVAEVVVLAVFRRLEARFRLDVLLAIAFGASAVRWLAIAAFDAPWALIAVQTLHGLSFGLFWCAAIALIAATVPGSLRATGQALLIISINIGGAIGNAVTGRLYDASGPRLMFVLAAILELAPLTVVILARDRLRATDGLVSSGP
jgi:PPP family 3-phenylpropionic acid transporter